MVILDEQWKDCQDRQKLDASPAARRGWYDTVIVSRIGITRQCAGRNIPVPEHITEAEVVRTGSHHSPSIRINWGVGGFGRFCYDFNPNKPLTRADITVDMWTRHRSALRQLGLSVYLMHPSGRDAIVACGPWAGTDCLSYIVAGIKAPTRHDLDAVYRRMEDLRITEKMPALPGYWHQIGIHIDTHVRGAVCFSYQPLGFPDAKRKISGRLAPLTPGRDYKSILGLALGQLPFPTYNRGRFRDTSEVRFGRVLVTTP